eukprot:CAMPEP_0202693202 /NCGR_PEP_ID=MMETSP1385-20130828/7377_1 /ASSEMBLY_ACC=CAM_ASM_000861 /TAXON_ID=933848 /ORGANISM="Elphidium margaritaceum" /LENGTH=976 /DNA_ID=CAMNT_0049348851 /DNA_START=13 /DNA_END=2943 /DNA_ORIENTATION=+
MAFLFFLYLLSLNHAYHISLTSLEWSSARDYCIEHCNSNLASIATQADFIELLDLIQYTLRDIHFSNSPFFYLGLNKLSSAEWSWSDGTDFQFGSSNTDGAQSPWHTNHTNASTGDCLALLPDTYEWSASDCLLGQNDDANNNFLSVCNHCHGQLNKHIFIDFVPATTTAQANKCSTYFGTTLSSVHGDDDMTEIGRLQQLVNQQAANAWSSDQALIGLVPSTWQYDDGTTYDFGNGISNAYPWGNREPGNSPQCIFMDATKNNLLVGDRCDDAFAVCNAPSLLCDSNAADWSIVTGTMSLSVGAPPCQAQMMSDVASTTLAVLHAHRWNNGGLLFVAEYTFGFTQITHPVASASAGLVFVIDTRCQHYLYINLEYGANVVAVTEMWNDTQTVLNATLLNFAIDVDVFYRLRAELDIVTQQLSVSVNEVLYVDALNVNVLKTSSSSSMLLSPYIGVQNFNSYVLAKSLFASGDIVFEEEKNNSSATAADWFVACSATTDLDIATTDAAWQGPESTINDDAWLSSTIMIEVTQIDGNDGNDGNENENEREVVHETTASLTIGVVDDSTEPDESVFAALVQSTELVIGCTVAVVLLCATLLVVLIYCKKRSTSKYDKEGTAAAAPAPPSAPSKAGRSQSAGVPRNVKAAARNRHAASVQMEVPAMTAVAVSSSSALRPRPPLPNKPPSRAVSLAIASSFDSAAFAYSAPQQRVFSFSRASMPSTRDRPLPLPLPMSMDSEHLAVSFASRLEEQRSSTLGAPNEHIFGEEVEIDPNDMLDDNIDGIENVAAMSAAASFMTDDGHDIDAIVDELNAVGHATVQRAQRAALGEHDDSDAKLDCELMDGASTLGESMKTQAHAVYAGQQRERFKSWLQDTVSLSMYFDTFVSHGYDTLDAIRVIQSTEELKEIGIKMNGHRTRLLSEIDKLKQESHSTFVRAHHDVQTSEDTVVDMPYLDPDYDLDVLDDINNAETTPGYLD